MSNKIKIAPIVPLTTLVKTAISSYFNTQLSWGQSYNDGGKTKRRLKMSATILYYRNSDETLYTGDRDEAIKAANETITYMIKEALATTPTSKTYKSTLSSFQIDFNFNSNGFRAYVYFDDTPLVEKNAQVQGIDNIKIVTNWDQMPPVVEADGQSFSTRVLAVRYRDMQLALQTIMKMFVETAEDAVAMQEVAKEALDFLKR